MHNKISALGVKKILLIIVVFILLFISYKIISYWNFKTDILITENKVIQINPGYTHKDLAKTLDINYYFLKKYLKNKDFKLLVWRFEIKENSTIEDILYIMKTPIAYKEISITILEWWNIFDIDYHLTKKWYISKWEYIYYVENIKRIKELSEFYKFLDPNLISLEWFLFPDTYRLNYPVKINELIIRQLNAFYKKVFRTILKEENLTNSEIYDLINLASIVEKEEKNILEKPTVAWILKKRLDNNWKIWADITLCYAHRLTSEECKMVITKYIREKSEYNTRTMVWLPKTPIWNPSFETINATLNYKTTPYWFYLHNIKTWKIYYWKTNAQHEYNKKFLY